MRNLKGHMRNQVVESDLSAKRRESVIMVGCDDYEYDTIDDLP